MSPITILLAEEQRVIREIVRNLLQAEEDIHVIAEAENGPQAVAFANKLAPDVVVIDLAMPLLSGLDAIVRIRECTPASTKILVLSSYDENDYVQHARALGASGYLVKQSGAHVLATAIRAIHQGHLYFKPIQHAAVQTP